MSHCIGATDGYYLNGQTALKVGSDLLPEVKSILSAVSGAATKAQLPVPVK